MDTINRFLKYVFGFITDNEKSNDFIRMFDSMTQNKYFGLPDLNHTKNRAITGIINFNSITEIKEYNDIFNENKAAYYNLHGIEEYEGKDTTKKITHKEIFILFDAFMKKYHKETFKYYPYNPSTLKPVENHNFNDTDTNYDKLIIFKDGERLDGFYYIDPYQTFYDCEDEYDIIKEFIGDSFNLNNLRILLLNLLKIEMKTRNTLINDERKIENIIPDLCANKELNTLLTNREDLNNILKDINLCKDYTQELLIKCKKYIKENNLNAPPIELAFL